MAEDKKSGIQKKIIVSIQERVVLQLLVIH